MDKDRVLKILATIVGLGGILLFVVLGVVVLSGRHKPSNEQQLALQRFHEHCLAVKAAMRTDEVMLEEQDPKEQDLAASQFTNLVTFHSTYEIDECSSVPPDLSERDACFLNHNYACLAKLAKLAGNSIDM